jgi:hypothetical protein
MVDTLVGFGGGVGNEFVFVNVRVNLFFDGVDRVLVLVIIASTIV